MLRVVKEPEDLYSKFRCYEHCCFCEQPTPFWVKSKDVACCEKCAKIHTIKQVPSKKVWWDAHILENKRSLRIT